MDRDNEWKEAFAFWRDMQTDAYRADESDRKVAVSLCAGIVVDVRGVAVCVEAGGANNVTMARLDPEQERALYEALRARFDAEHRGAVEHAALAKLSPLEQEVLRARWGKTPETTTKGPAKVRKRGEL